MTVSTVASRSREYDDLEIRIMRARAEQAEHETRKSKAEADLIEFEVDVMRKGIGG